MTGQRSHEFHDWKEKPVEEGQVIARNHEGDICQHARQIGELISLQNTILGTETRIQAYEIFRYQSFQQADRSLPRNCRRNCSFLS